jgi:hypothetical protein
MIELSPVVGLALPTNSGTVVESVYTEEYRALERELMQGDVSSP